MLKAIRDHGIVAHHVLAVHIPESLLNLTTLAVLHLALRRPIIVDVLEKHDRAQFSMGRFAPYFIRHRWSAFLTARFAKSITAVSSALGQHFSDRGADVLVVPPQVDCEDYALPVPPPIGTGLRLVYAGNPGAKDMLDVLIEGIRKLSGADQARIELVIAGITQSEASRLSDLRQSGVAALRDRVIFLGQVPRAQVLDLLARSHFSVLVRPTRGYAEFGFPSKVPESLAAGCPVILNYSSDLAHYIRDGKEGIVLGGSTPDDVRSGLETALAMSDTQWSRMSQAAQARARESFDYRSWVSRVAAFVAASADNRRDWSKFARSSAVRRRAGG
jgi:glycosyltransferase involved in cell wall biosynthesis